MALQLSFSHLSLAIVVLVAIKCLLKRWNALHLPPGPPRFPFLGNVLDMPKWHEAHEIFHDMNTKYGDVVYLEVLGQPMIILGSHETALDLLEKRSAIYSDRMPSVMIASADVHWIHPFQGYGAWWRRHRRALHQYFNGTAVKCYHTSQKLDAHLLVCRLIDSPQDFLHHLRHYVGSSIMRVTYGIDVDDAQEDYLGIAEAAMALLSSTLAPGRHLVETFPSLRFLPSWVPGAREFRRDADRLLYASRAMRDVPWGAALAGMSKGVAPPSMVSGLMSSLNEEKREGAELADDSEETVIRNAAGNAYGAGADTTLLTVQWFFVAMILFPEVQKRAQEELMAVVGPHRLPEFEDEVSLPYIQALTKECLRWRPVSPLGVPHRVLEDDRYRGYRIPKGSMVIYNIWSYCRRPDVYPDPEGFRPERFLKDGMLDPDAPNPANIAFGYGRRACPGRRFAESSLFIVIASILHTLNISPSIEDGEAALPSGKAVTTGFLSYPEPFKCTIKSRSSEMEVLTRASCKELKAALTVVNIEITPTQTQAHKADT